MIHKTRGVVLGSIKYSDTSLIVKVYTRLFGLQSYILKGVRTSKKNKVSFFQPLTILELEAYHKAGKQIQFLKEFAPAYICKTLSFDVVKSSVVIFLADVLGKAVREEEPNEPLYDFIEQSLIAFDSNAKIESNFHLFFLIKLAMHLGFAMQTRTGNEKYFDLTEGRFTNEMPVHHLFTEEPCTSALHALISGEEQLKMKLDVRNLVLDKILQYYQIHIQGFGKISSHHVLHDVLEALQT